MSRRRQGSREDSVDAILDRVRRAHEQADAAGEGLAGPRAEPEPERVIDRLEPRTASRPRTRHAPTRVDPGHPSPPGGGRAGDIDRYDPTPPPAPAPPRDPERTLHRFRYPDYGADAPVDSGEGKSVDDPDRTRTRIAPPPRRRGK